jgi:hypothetical protein
MVRIIKMSGQLARVPALKGVMPLCVQMQCICLKNLPSYLLSYCVHFTYLKKVGSGNLLLELNSQKYQTSYISSYFITRAL